MDAQVVVELRVERDAQLIARAHGNDAIVHTRQDLGSFCAGI